MNKTKTKTILGIFFLIAWNIFDHSNMITSTSLAGSKQRIVILGNLSI